MAAEPAGPRRRPQRGGRGRHQVVDGKVTYAQFQEDSYATAASFRQDGSWIVQTEPGAEPFQV
jgi:hypothetical protein